MNAPLFRGAPAPGQADLFANSPSGPEGFRYQPALITEAEETALAGRLAGLPFKPFDFHGHLAHREVIAFGRSYDDATRRVGQAEPIPDFLLPLRARIAAFAGQPDEAFEQVLINDYPPGAGIGWHRDRPHFEDVVGVSLLAPCGLRFRRKAGERWERMTVPLEARSAYLLTGPSRREWQHSIAPLDRRRYSITFRTPAAALNGRQTLV